MREISCPTCGNGRIIRYTAGELRRMREAWGLSFSDIAAAGGFESVGHLCDMEKKRREPTDNQVRAYLRAIDIRAKAEDASNNHAREGE